MTLTDQERSNYYLTNVIPFESRIMNKEKMPNRKKLWVCVCVCVCSNSVCLVNTIVANIFIYVPQKESAWSQNEKETLSSVSFPWMGFFQRPQRQI